MKPLYSISLIIGIVAGVATTYQVCSNDGYCADILGTNNRWAAFAFAKDGSFGFSSRQANPESAKTNAKDICQAKTNRSICDKVLVLESGQCVSLGEGTRIFEGRTQRGYGISIRNSAGEAEVGTLRNCQEAQSREASPRGCRIVVTKCVK